MAANIISPVRSKQPLSERSPNEQSPIKSPSKIPLPPSPVNNSHKPHNEMERMEKSIPQDGPIPGVWELKDVTLPKPALFRDISQGCTCNQTYISPSDNILSPTTKKLTEVKGRRFANSKKTSVYNPAKLFARPDTTIADTGNNWNKKT